MPSALASIPSSSTFSRFARLSLLSSALVLAACSTLPPYQPQPVEYAFHTPTDQTSLAQLVLPLREQYPELTGYHVLHDPLEALAARLHLIERAEKTLDLQYYIWDKDKIGKLALDAIIRAADRGVKVRLLVDDMNSKNMQASYLALDQHINIDVRLYNPHRFRNLRAMDMILDLKRINRRMHNKSFIADNQISLIGGRNMGDMYYNISDQYQFADVDVMLVGYASDEIIHSFDEYWNDDYAYPVASIVDYRKFSLRFPELREELTQHAHDTHVQNYLDLASRSKAFENWLNQEIRFDWVKADVVKDSPSKIKQKATKEQHLNFQLLSHLDKPQQSVDIVSAYFVPEKEGAERLIGLAERGVKVRVLTNSYQANDVPLVHAFYAKYRKELLKGDVKLYEFLSAPENAEMAHINEELAEKTKVSLKGLSHSSLHAKMMALDESQVFIGSFNFDPRSAYLNTEIGVLLHSPNLARGIHHTMDNDLKKYAYKLVLDANENINWRLARSQQEPKVYLKEPKMKWWEKAGIKIVSWLPIEKFM